MDPITLEVIKNALSSIADEMALVLMRSAYSPVVRDSMDYSTALCDRHGQVIAQGLTLAVPVPSAFTVKVPEKVKSMMSVVLPSSVVAIAWPVRSPAPLAVKTPTRRMSCLGAVATPEFGLPAVPS